MSSNICLFIKPKIRVGDDFMQQQREFRVIVKPAIKQAGLTLFDPEHEGTAISEISSELVEKISEADIVIVDANRYEETGLPLSPPLCYFIGLRHAFGNRTILIARASGHLPASFQKHHTLFYSHDDPPEFYERFEKVAKSILSGENDNPTIRSRSISKRSELLKRVLGPRRSPQSRPPSLQDCSGNKPPPARTAQRQKSPSGPSN